MLTMNANAEIDDTSCELMTLKVNGDESTFDTLRMVESR